MCCPCRPRQLVVGRGRGRFFSAIRRVWVTDPTVSEQHAALTWDPAAARFRLHHRSATNPTLVNGRAVTETLLHDNDVIQMGQLICRVVHHAGTRVHLPRLSADARGRFFLSSR